MPSGDLYIHPSEEWRVQPNLSPSLKTVEKILKILSNTPSITVQETNVIFGGRLAEYKYYDMWRNGGSGGNSATSVTSAILSN